MGPWRRRSGRRCHSIPDRRPLHRRRLHPHSLPRLTKLFFFQAEDGIRDADVTGVQTCALPILARSGARGSMLNLSQMAGSIGQQAVRGERLSRGYWNRTLPHFKKGDLGAEAKGFVKASYKSGLSPTEYFFHSMGGREGLVDTAVRTSRSGYMQRRLINALEDLKVKEDGTVRNTADTIIQFRFGEDGVDPSRSVQGRAVDIDDILQEVLGEEPSWKERLREQELASYCLTEKDMYVELSEEEVEVEEEEPPSEE